MLCGLCPTWLIETANNGKLCDPEPIYVNAFQQRQFAPPEPAPLALSSLSIQFMPRMGRALERMVALDRTEPAARRAARSRRRQTSAQRPRPHAARGAGRGQQAILGMKSLILSTREP